VSPATRERRGGRASDTLNIFRGRPHRLVCHMSAGGEDGEWTGARSVSAELEGAEVQSVTVFPGRSERTDTLRLSLRVRASTPPGRYRGSVRFDDHAFPIAAEVEPWQHVRCEPRRLTIEAQPSGQISADVTVCNGGNVPCVVPGSSNFCLFDGHGIDHAFWVALTAESSQTTSRVDLLLDDLSKSHGGLVRVQVSRGKGAIAPGESRDVRLRLRFSERLRPGRGYVGAWDIDGMRLPVRVSAVGADASAEEARA
jgi:hypothetical protein